MAGHSKWSNIKYKKKITDAKKNKLSTKLIKDITNAVKDGGKDVRFNSKLKNALNKASLHNINKSTINKIIDNNVHLSKIKTVMYAGFWICGVVILLECVPLNRNKIASELRNIFNKNDGELVPINSVCYLFQRLYKFYILSTIFNNVILNKELNITASKQPNIIYVGDDSVSLLKKYLNKLEHEIESEMVMYPHTFIFLEKDKVLDMLKLIKKIKNLDYIINVFTNVSL